jgi:hypothetical protein
MQRNAVLWRDFKNKNVFGGVSGVSDVFPGLYRIFYFYLFYFKNKLNKHRIHRIPRSALISLKKILKNRAVLTGYPMYVFCCCK